MKKSELFFPSKDKKTNIHMVIWEPDNEVLGVIEVVHGVTEHIMRYEEMAYYFTNRNVAVVGIDLLGHGLSTNNGNKVMYFGKKGSWDYVVDDVERCLVHAKELHPNIPILMLGFSLGSFLVRTHMIKNPGFVDGVVLVGTGYNSNLEISLAQSVVKSETRKYGDNVATDKIRNLTFGMYNKKFKPNKTDYDWLCSDEEALEEYMNDELVGKNMTVGLFRELLNGMKYTCDRNNIKKVDCNKPVLLLSGEKDSVGKDGKGVEKVYSLFKKAGVRDVSIKVYDGLRHDILHEKSHFSIYEDIFNWMKARRLILDNKKVLKEEVRAVKAAIKHKKSEKALVNSKDVKSILSKK